MSNLTKSRKEVRLKDLVSEDSIVSERTYNVILGLTVLYGLVTNIIMYLVFGDMTASVHPFLFLIGYFISCIIGTAISSKSTNPIISFIGYNFIVVPIGMVLSSILELYGNISSVVVLQAFIITAGLVACMIIVAIVYPNIFDGLGEVLLVCLFGLIVIEIISSFFGVQHVVTAWISAGLFTVYIGYDFVAAQNYPKTIDNAVDSAVDIYLDIINLFISMLEILGKKDD